MTMQQIKLLIIIAIVFLYSSPRNDAAAREANKVFTTEELAKFNGKDVN
jgi:hypothetical protein